MVIDLLMVTHQDQNYQNESKLEIISPNEKREEKWNSQPKNALESVD